MGTIYKRPKSKFWWIQYYDHGKRYQESAGTTKKKEALEILRQKEGEIAGGATPSIRYEQIKFSELIDDFIA